MATRGSIPKMMELAGIDMLPPEAGIPLIRRELTSGGTCGEIVVGQRLGIMLSEWDATGGLDVQALEASSPGLPAQGPMIGKITGMGLYNGLVIETTLDPTIQPFLYDHKIDDTPVLPGVMGIEAFAEAAQSLLPGWHVGAVEEVNFLAPFKFYRNQPRTLTIQAVVHPQGKDVVADCRLTGSRSLPNQPEPQITTHFTARVRLTQQVSETPTVRIPAAANGSSIKTADIYRVYFHGPAYQVVEGAWRDGDRMVGQMAAGLPSNHEPPALQTVMGPRLIELCFQTAGLWQMSEQGVMGLPLYVRQVRVWRVPERSDIRFYAVVTPHPDQESFDAEVVDANGNGYIQLISYKTVALPNSVDAEPLKALQAAMAQHVVMA